MHGDIRLGRLAGFPLAMHWSVVLIAWLVAWGTSSSILPQTAPGYTTTEYWVAGAVGAVIFFGSLLAHELAHALVARTAGVQVLGLTLWLFGGVATLRGEATTARDDLRIAGAGPLTSLGLAGAFSALAVVLTGSGAPQLVLSLAAWLAVVNLVLGVFNLLPGAPLDGGRVLRAWLWHRTGDRLQATLGATRAGQRTGVVLSVLGLAEILVGADLGGLWLVFIGWFVISSAKTEEATALTMQALTGLVVADVMTPHPDVVPESLTVRELAAGLPWRAHEVYPTVDAEGRPTGLLVLSRLSAVPLRAEGTTLVRDVAVALTDSTTASSCEPLADALTRTAADGDGRFAVVDEGRLVGVVTPSDLNRVLRLQRLGAARVGPGKSQKPATAA